MLSFKLLASFAIIIIYIYTISGTYPPPEIGFKTVGFISFNNLEYQNFDTLYLREKFAYINVACFANGQIDSNGLADIGYPGALRQIVALRKKTGVKIFLSIQASASKWNLITSSLEKQRSFIKSLMSKVRHYQLNGIDIDWEFPNTQTSTRFTNLIKELSDSCHTNGRYYLSGAKPRADTFTFVTNHMDSIKMPFFIITM